MDSKKKLGIGALLAILGGIGMALGPTLGVTMLGRPWSFIAGFVVGVMAGVGVALAISSLIEVRHEKKTSP